MSFQTIREVFLNLCEHANSPRALGYWMRFRYEVPEKPPAFEIKPHLTVDEFRKDYLCYSYVRKLAKPIKGVDPKQACYQAFLDAEATCKATNERLKRVDGLTPRQSAVFHSAQRKISAILGPFSTSVVLNHCGWSNGAAYDVPKRAAYVDYKMTKVPFSVTPRCYPYARLILESDPHWMEAITGVYPSGPYSIVSSCWLLTKGNKVTSVAKDSFTDRGIAVEPRMNMFLQKGVGSFIRSRLKRHGVDLNDQSKNQNLAYLALYSGLATIDLKSASDTISVELIAQLLPVDWFNYLDSIRSRQGLLNGKFLTYEKFSSMGNGFTFELESLVFYALACASIEEYGEVADASNFSIYGDDIIVPAACYSLLVEVLNAAGFSINTEKSFASGSFYESCGKHYYNGADVTPVYQKVPLDELESIRAYNRLYRWFGEKHHAFHPYRRESTFKSIKIPDSSIADDGFLEPLVGFRFDVNGRARIRVVKMLSRSLPANESALYAYMLRRVAGSALKLPVDKCSTRAHLTILSEGDGHQEVHLESGRAMLGYRTIYNCFIN